MDMVREDTEFMLEVCKTQGQDFDAMERWTASKVLMLCEAYLRQLVYVTSAQKRAKKS